MSKKKAVPASLHAELSEYTALLRALKTRDLLDLTTQLTTPEITRRAEWDPSFPPPSSSPAPSPPVAGPSRQKRDQWTRWPLPVKDVYIPQWSLDDEIAVIARKCIKNQLDSLDIIESNPDSDSDLDPDLADTLPPHIPPLTQSVHQFLTTTLNLIALQTPPRVPSMMNRIDVISWPHVLNSLGPALDTKGKGMFAPDLIQRAARRLEEIYGPPDFNDGPNLKKPTTIKTNPHFKSLLPPKLSLSKMLRNAQKDLFHVRPLTPGMIQRIEDKERRLNKAKRKRKQSRKLIEGTDSESDYAPPSKKRKKSASDTGSRRATSSIASRKATSSAGPRISTLSTESKKSSSSTRSVTSSTGSNEGAPSTPGAPSKGKGKATEDEPAGPRTRRQSTRNKP